MARKPRDYQKEYERRIARGIGQIGLTRDQARGHPGKGRAKASEVIRSLAAINPDKVRPAGHGRPARPKPPRYAPPATPHTIMGPRESRQVTTPSLRDVGQQAMRMKDSERVYFAFWNRNTGSYEYLYRGNSAHGISGQFLKERIQEKLDNGDARTPREALLQIFDEDISSFGNNKNYSHMSAIPASGRQAQFSMHVMQD